MRQVWSNLSFTVGAQCLRAWGHRCRRSADPHQTAPTGGVTTLYRAFFRGSWLLCSCKPQLHVGSPSEDKTGRGMSGGKGMTGPWLTQTCNAAFSPEERSTRYRTMVGNPPGQDGRCSWSPPTFRHCSSFPIDVYCHFLPTQTFL